MAGELCELMDSGSRDLSESCGQWFLVSTQTGREDLAALHLSRQGYRPFVPSSWRTIRHARKIRTERAAYFPGYLFVPLDLERDCWRPIDGTIGVLRVVKANGRPLPAPRGLVDALIAMTDATGSLDLVGAAPKPGQSARIIRGPFADQLVTIDSLKGAERVRVLLQLMNNTVPVEVSRQDLALSQV